MDALRLYDWPGNVRELKNVIERAVILSEGNQLRLDLSLTAVESPKPTDRAPSAAPVEPAFVTDAEMRDRMRANIIAALEAADWRVSGGRGAAKLLGMKPSTLSDRMRVLGISRPR